ncbi:MAG TPA: transketolase [Candidatus Omnitrophica bacterium]|nr:MAG: transketolase [Candidatus Omnitrophota bacterium]RKY45023.1 MAG: transketolase [Candidatus Omnitrophota bacterium]HEC69464.1 transketolase [Candidatus Omnitrophota bacterium]
MNPAKIKFLKKKANQIRKLIIKMLSRAGSGHPGGSLSCAEIITCLYFEVMRHNPKDPNWPERDRFHLSKGHACPAWYSALSLAGYFEEKHLFTLRRLGSILQGHPDRRTPGVEVASGSLGQGLSVALGMSLALRLDKRDSRVYCLMGDGEIQEGNIWEAAMASAHFKVDNLCGIVDYNRFQIDGRIEKIMNIEPLVNKWESFGWHVVQADGHNIEELLEAFGEAKQIKGKPTVIIAHTVKGKGVSFMEHVVDFHGRAPTKEEEKIALKELEDLEGFI